MYYLGTYMFSCLRLLKHQKRKSISSKTYPWKAYWSAKMLQDKKPQVGSNIVNPLRTQCQTSQAAIIGIIPIMSFVHYLSFWTKLLQPNNFYFKKMFPLSVINETPKVLQWIQCCLKDHVLRLKIDGFLSKIIQYWAVSDINMNI